ncbi:MAG: hypothetical protein J5506_04880 [Prevotella sp.]|nr:hypothetical protein [Prevotella sp.]
MFRLYSLIAGFMICSVAFAQEQNEIYTIKHTSVNEDILHFKGINELTDKDKAGYYNLIVDSALISPANDAAVLALKAGILCDMYDVLANKGIEERTKYRKMNHERLLRARPKVIDAGLDAYHKGYYSRAMDCFDLYLNCRHTTLFSDLNPESDPYYGQCAFYASQASYQAKDYDAANKFLAVALSDEEYAQEAAELKIAIIKESCITKEDTLQYIEALDALHLRFPTNSYYFGLLMEYYTQPGHEQELKQFVREEVKLDNMDKKKWALYGEVEMDDRNWDKAIEGFNKALALDPNFLQAMFNSGLCHVSKGIDTKERRWFTEGRNLLERCRVFDPERKIVNWAKPLYQAYYHLGEKSKAKEIAKMAKLK